MLHLFVQNVRMAFNELRTNKLRTLLSLLGVTIGVFCIISVLSVFDSLQYKIQTDMNSLGNEVLYVGKFPWIPEDKGEYKWWKYKARPTCKLHELEAIKKNAPSAGYSTICYTDEDGKLKYEDNEAKRVNLFAVTYDFNKLQPIDIEQGRYFSLSEMEHGQSNGIVLGSQLCEDVFGVNANPLDKFVTLYGKKFQVIGVLKKLGKTMTGFDFDGGVIITYHYLKSILPIESSANNDFLDPLFMIKVKEGKNYEEMKYEVKGILRAARKIKPNEKDNFSFNELSGIQDSIKEIFSSASLVGAIIGLFSIIVGIFGVANIMFVSVKERTNLIGIKKAIGAKKRLILSEFLIESILLCTLGGLIGIAFVFILAKLLSYAFEFPIFISSFNFCIGLGLSILVGLLAGYIPARQAANLNPVVAIRS